jgi:ATP-dependent Lon protease
MMFVTDSCIL